MAANVDDVEREKRIELVGDYFYNQNTSVRKTTEFFSMNFFPISVATVYDYLNKYMKKYPDKEEKIKEKLHSNKATSIENRDIRNRVINNARYILLGYTIEEVSKYTKTSYWTVYRDLTERLPKIDLKINEEVMNLLNERKMGNLRNGK